MKTALLVAVAAMLLACGGEENPTEVAVAPVTCALYETTGELLCVCTDEEGALIAIPPASNCVPPLP